MVLYYTVTKVSWRWHEKKKKKTLRIWEESESVFHIRSHNCLLSWALLYFTYNINLHHLNFFDSTSWLLYTPSAITKFFFSRIISNNWVTQQTSFLPSFLQSLEASGPNLGIWTIVAEYLHCCKHCAGYLILC